MKTAHISTIEAIFKAHMPHIPANDQEWVLDTLQGTDVEAALLVDAIPTIKNEDYTLWHVMGNVERDFSKSMVKFLSCKKATLDYMKETGFKIPTYEKMIEDIATQVSSLVIWEKYLTSSSVS